MKLLQNEEKSRPSLVCTHEPWYHVELQETQSLQRPSRREWWFREWSDIPRYLQSHPPQTKITKNLSNWSLNQIQYSTRLDIIFHFSCLTFFHIYNRQCTIVYKDHKENKATLQVSSCLVTAQPIDSKINSNINTDCKSDIQSLKVYLPNIAIIQRTE